MRACAVLPVLALAGASAPAPLAMGQDVQTAAGLDHQVNCRVDMHASLDGAPAGFREDAVLVAREVEDATGIDVRIVFDLRSKSRDQPDAQKGVTVVNVVWDRYDPKTDAIVTGPRSLWGLADTAPAADGPAETSVVLLNSTMLEPFSVTLSGKETHFGAALLPGAPTPDRPFRVVSLLRHEIGHVLGLPHADRLDPSSTMTAQPSVFRGSNSWSDDSRRTLAAGYAHCRD